MAWNVLRGQEDVLELEDEELEDADDERLLPMAPDEGKNALRREEVDVDEEEDVDGEEDADLEDDADEEKDVELDKAPRLEKVPRLELELEVELLKGFANGSEY